MDDEITEHPAISLEQLFIAEESRLLRFATELTGSFAAAQDVVQEAFIRLNNERKNISQPRAWLFRVVRNFSLNHRRKNARAESLDALDAAGAQFHDTGDAPPEQLEHTEKLLFVRLCLADLPARDRDLLTLKYENDLSYEAIAQRTGLTAGNVGFRLHHALKKLTDAFACAENFKPGKQS